MTNTTSQLQRRRLFIVMRNQTLQNIFALANPTKGEKISNGANLQAIVLDGPIKIDKMLSQNSIAISNRSVQPALPLALASTYDGKTAWHSKRTVDSKSF
jgi:hypothetical protein